MNRIDTIFKMYEAVKTLGEIGSTNTFMLHGFKAVEFAELDECWSVETVGGYQVAQREGVTLFSDDVPVLEEHIYTLDEIAEKFEIKTEQLRIKE